MAAEMQVGDLPGSADVQSVGEPRYRFKDGIWNVICDVMTWPTMTAAAEALHIRDTTISRAVTGETYPGEKLMARVMNALPRTWKHEHVFELVLEDEQ